MIRMYSKYERRTDTGHMRTGRNFMKVDGRSSALKLWMLPGRRSTTSGPRGPPRSCPSGSERDPAKRPEMLRHLKAKKMMEKKRKRRKRRRRRRSKLNPQASLICQTFLTGSVDLHVLLKSFSSGGS